MTSSPKLDNMMNDLDLVLAIFIDSKKETSILRCSSQFYCNLFHSNFAIRYIGRCRRFNRFDILARHVPEIEKFQWNVRDFQICSFISLSFLANTFSSNISLNVSYVHKFFFKCFINACNLGSTIWRIHSVLYMISKLWNTSPLYLFVIKCHKQSL